MQATKLKNKIDEAIEKNQDTSLRPHLGASIIGRECARQIWYLFRWVKNEKRCARKLRIFDRGKKEEDRVKQWFDNADIKLWTHNSKGYQYTISDCGGHFAGSLDGVTFNIPDLPNKYLVVEMKTHNEKSFKKLQREGVEKAHKEHYVQGTVYAYKKKLNYVLYIAVNKNNDSIYYEVFKIKNSVAKHYIKRANRIIYSDEAPPRIANTIMFYKCKMCPFQDVCWGREAPEINCRTCVHSLPKKLNKKWQCTRFNKEISTSEQRKGCRNHIYNPSMLASCKFITASVDKGRHFIKLKIDYDNADYIVIIESEDNRKIIKHGPSFITSKQLSKMIWKLHSFKLVNKAKNKA